jgi:glutamate N-acetyltransferase/amino-acid N-acetyltransferase
MLAFILTDAFLTGLQAEDILRRAADASFNCISVEGHTSTNDTVFLLANGTGPPVREDDPAFHALDAAVHQVCAELARDIAADAEGAAHLIVLHVDGCRSDAEARQVAKAVAESALVKTAVFGADPNWGRIVSAAGYAGIPFEEKDLSLWLGDLLLYRDGTPVPFDAATASAYLRQHREVHVRLRFALGPGRCTFYTSDLTYEYVKLNAEYTT